MSIELTEDAKRIIDGLVARGRYASAEEAVNALITKAGPRRTCDNRSKEEIVAAQKKAGQELLKKIKDMPVDPNAPEFTARDHDRVLYGGEL
jgi:Arc/MetJ-type ribon-helix-helix transcriptional regulator